MAYIYIGSVDFHSGIKLSRFQKSLVFQRVIRVVVYTYHCWERPLLPASSPKSRDDFLMRSKYCNHNSPLNLGCPPVIMWLNPLTIAMIPIGPGCSTSPTEISSQTIRFRIFHTNMYIYALFSKSGIAIPTHPRTITKKNIVIPPPFCIQRVHSLGQVASQVAISGSATTFTLSSSPCSSPSSWAWAPWNKPTTKYN